MDYYKLYILLSFAIGAVGLLLGGLNFLLSENNIGKAEKLCRNYKFGVVIWFACLIWCIPHTEVIIFKSLVPYLWYIAVVIAILSYFYLDYLMARAFAGSLIIGGYYILHSTFDYHSQMAVLLSIVAWLIGIAGIVFSAKPSYLRDLLRVSARNKRVKILVSIVISVFSLLLVGNGILELMK